MQELILAIDTSFDETSVSVVRGFTILSNILPSQMEFHQKYGGVVPSIAKLAHAERIDNVVEEALKKARIKLEDIDVFAVTYGPGLAITLEIGIKKAKELAEKNKKPLIAINHMEGHLVSAFAKRDSKEKASNDILPATFPIIGFLISGGHTELVLVRDFGDYEKIGETLDDSCGEAYDKCGRMLGLGYPAGPVISEFAKRHRKNMEIKVVKDNQSTLVKIVNKKSGAEYQLPIAMVNSGDLNFSYSGLKTAFKNLIEKVSGQKLVLQAEAGELKGLTKEQIFDLCVIFEVAALTQLNIKLERAIKKFAPKEVWLGGGVVASARLRSEMRTVCKKYGIKVRHPYTKKLTGDNAAMIAVTANIRLSRMKKIQHDPKSGIYLKDFNLVDRDPTLSL